MADDNFPERVDYAIQKMGGIRPASRKTQISTTTLDNYRAGSEPSRARLVSIADNAGVDLLWLATGRGQPDASASGFEHVPIIDVKLAAGAATFSDAAQRIGDMPFDRELLRMIGFTNTDGLVVVEAEGDSMEPLIADGGRVLVSLKDTRLREGIFAFRFDDELRLKRLRRLADGVEISSENPRYRPEILTGADLDRFAVIGRAVWTGTII